MDGQVSPRSWLSSREQARGRQAAFDGLRSAERVGALTPARALAGLVVAAFAARVVLAFARPTPTYFPDEYLYSALARSLAANGHPLVRGEPAHFPAMLQPLLTAPVWLIGNTAVAYRAEQVLACGVMSLAPVPVYALCRALGLRWPAALGAAVYALSLPAFMYSSWLIAEPYAYPLALVAVLTGTLALGRGERRWQILFLTSAAAAALARTQLLVLPAAYLLAALALGLRTRSLRTVVREQTLVLGILATGLVALAATPRHMLGIYGGAHLHPSAVLPPLGMNALVLVYACAVVIVPGALFGTAYAIARPRTRVELAFACFAVFAAVGMLLQASLWGDLDRPQERYFIYLLPLVAVLFALNAARGFPGRRGYVLLCATGVVLAAKVPLSGYAASTIKTHSPTLYGVFEAEQLLGTGNGAIAVSLSAAVLALIAAALPIVGRRAAAVGLALASACLFLAGAGAAAVELQSARLARSSYLPADRSWVDDAHVGRVTLVRGGASPGDALSQLFWNRSIDRIVVLPGGWPADVFDEPPVTIRSDGTLVAGGRPLRGAILADEWITAMRFRAARVVGASRSNELVVPAGRVQLMLYSPGFYRDGWLGRSGSIHLWPARAGGLVAGRLTIRLSAPSWLPSPVTVGLSRDGAPDERLTMAPGTGRTVTWTVCRSGPWNAGLEGDHAVLVLNRLVTVRATAPAWRPDPAACPL